jgi:hypothetical protein
VGGPLDGARTVRVWVKSGLDRSAEELSGARKAADVRTDSAWRGDGVTRNYDDVAHVGNLASPWRAASTSAAEQVLDHVWSSSG